MRFTEKAFIQADLNISYKTEMTKYFSGGPDLLESRFIISGSWSENSQNIEIESLGHKYGSNILDNLEFKISSIDLLSEIIDKEVRDIVLRVDINDISDVMVEEVVHLISDNPGKHSLVFNVVDHLNKYEVDLLSRKMKVKLDKDFTKQLNSLSQIKMRVK